MANTDKDFNVVFDRETRQARWTAAAGAYAAKWQPGQYDAVVAARRNARSPDHFLLLLENIQGIELAPARNEV